MANDLSVLTAINESGVPCAKRKDGLPVHFKFNNSALFVDNKLVEANNEDDEDEEDGGGNFDKMFWDMGTKSMNIFFSSLNLIETKSLTLTKEVLRQRRQLENSIENLQKKVKLGLAKLEEIKQESQILQTNEAAITANGILSMKSATRSLLRLTTIKEHTPITVSHARRPATIPAVYHTMLSRICDAMDLVRYTAQMSQQVPWTKHFTPEVPLGLRGRDRETNLPGTERQVPGGHKEKNVRFRTSSNRWRWNTTTCRTMWSD